MNIEKNLFNPKRLKFKKVNDRIKIWIDALRSDHYAQGGERELYGVNTNTYCCLGVANSACALNECSRFYLETTYRKMGLKDQFGSVGLNSLSVMNDRLGATFTELADLIELHHKEALNWLSTQENSK
jgi:hypothetical protein